MNWITDTLAVGDVGDLDNQRYLRKLRLTVIDVRPIFSEHAHIVPNEGNEIAVETWDIDWDKLNELVMEIQGLDFVGKKVMLHCQAGIDRSPFVAAYYLFQTGDWTMEEAYNRVKRKRPETFIHAEWMNQVLDWQSTLEK